MLIGEVSERTGASRKAIRHYESIGLIPPPSRRGNYRVYSEHEVAVITMIRRAQSLGFSLSELKEVVFKKNDKKKLPFDYIGELLDKKILDLKSEAQQLLLKIDSVEKFKSDLFRSLS